MRRASFSLVLALSILAGCKSNPPQEVKAASAPKRNPMQVTCSPDLMKEIETGEPKWQEVAGQLRVSGRVAADETRISHVSSPVTGRIVELDVVEGQTVRKGQLIALVHTTQLSGTQSEFLKARSQRLLAERAVQRARSLLDAGVIGEAELQRREAELAQNATEVAALRDQLRVLGMSDEALAQLQETGSVNSRAQVLAPTDGTVLERRATLGQVIDAADIVATLADLSRVWVVADVPEQSSGTLRTGKSVEVEIPALPGQLVRGTLAFVSQTVNPETRTVSTRMNLLNPNGRYKPAMLATMAIKEAAERQRVVPASAIVRENNQDFLFVKTGERTFVLRQVMLGGEFGDLRVVAGGLQPGETVVLDGAFHLNNERRRLALQGS